MATAPSDICMTSLVIVNVSDISLACSSYKLLPVRRPRRRSVIRWDNLRVRDLGILSHVAKLMVPCSLSPLFPMSNFHVFYEVFEVKKAIFSFSLDHPNCKLIHIDKITLFPLSTYLSFPRYKPSFTNQQVHGSLTCLWNFFNYIII